MLVASAKFDSTEKESKCYLRRWLKVVDVMLEKGKGPFLKS